MGYAREGKFSGVSLLSIVFANLFFSLLLACPSRCWNKKGPDGIPVQPWKKVGGGEISLQL
jgi:hypothetical protein